MRAQGGAPFVLGTGHACLRRNLAYNGHTQELREGSIMAGEQQPRVLIGSRVVVELIDEAGGVEDLVFTLVDDAAASFADGLLGAGTPLGRAIVGRTQGSTLAYRQGGMHSVRIVGVTESADTPPGDAAERRRQLLDEARRKAERTTADMFATSFSSKWGGYDTTDMAD